MWAAVGLADCSFYREAGHKPIPAQGPLAALTVAGAVSGWKKAFDFNRKKLGGRLPLHRLLEDSIYLLKDGIAVSGTLAANACAKADELKDVPGFKPTYFVDEEPPPEAAKLQQPNLSATLSQTASVGLDDFYRGEIARAISADIESAGSPIRLTDLQAHQAAIVEPLSIEIGSHQIF